MCVHIRLHKYQSRVKIQAFVDKYNNSLPLNGSGRRQLGKFLRQQHAHLIEHLLELYHLEINRARALGHTPTFGECLPSFRTNNVQLAKRMNCAERTVRGLRDRLKAAGIIEAEKFHGSNSSFEVWLNADLLHMSSRETENGNAAEFFSRPDGRPALQQLQTLPHTVTSKNLLGTNKLIELSGVENQQPVENQAIEVSNDVEKPQNTVEKPGQVVDLQQLSKDGKHQVPETGYRTSKREKPVTPPQFRAAPPAVAPADLEEVKAGLVRADANRLEKLVEVMYRNAITHLFPDWWIADSEAARTKARLAEYLRYAPTENWTRGTNEVLERMILVKRWIDRHHGGEGKYLKLLPSTYFDIRNTGKVSFGNTKSWVKAHRAALAEIHDNVQVTKAVHEYLKSQEPGAKIGPAEAYRRISQRLNKRNNSLLNLFHQQITDHENSTAA